MGEQKDAGLLLVETSNDGIDKEKCRRPAKKWIRLWMEPSIPRKLSQVEEPTTFAIKDNNTRHQSGLVSPILSKNIMVLLLISIKGLTLKYGGLCCRSESFEKQGLDWEEGCHLKWIYFLFRLLLEPKFILLCRMTKSNSDSASVELLTFKTRKSWSRSV